MQFRIKLKILYIVSKQHQVQRFNKSLCTQNTSISKVNYSPELQQNSHFTNFSTKTIFTNFIKYRLAHTFSKPKVIRRILSRSTLYLNFLPTTKNLCVILSLKALKSPLFQKQVNTANKKEWPIRI